jgi:CDP-diacylglycerol--glycerol-3-phosphate 3-phosphatidyltransferase
MLSKLPNALSGLRAIIAPFLFLAIGKHDTQEVAILAAVAVITDFLDGFLARRLNAISQAGKILDPLADKLCVAAAAIGATIFMNMPILLLIVIILRDLMIAIFGLSIISRRRQIPVSNIWGKVTVFILTVTLIVYIFEIRSLIVPAYLLSLAFILISSYSYFNIGLRMLKSEQHQ